MFANTIPVRELGIDEAGRGPVLGPMVLAGVVVPKTDAALLRRWGVTDSKRFGSQAEGQRQRSNLAVRIKQTFVHHVICIPSGIVDHYVHTKSLNILEQETALQIIDALPVDRVFLDGYHLFKSITNQHIHAIDKADQSHLSVAAASILAKHTRDEEFGRLCAAFKKEYGEVKGGGYANSVTLNFVKWHLKKNGKLPAFYRKSFRWKSLSP